MTLEWDNDELFWRTLVSLARKDGGISSTWDAHKLVDDLYPPHDPRRDALQALHAELPWGHDRTRIERLLTNEKMFVKFTRTAHRSRDLLAKKFVRKMNIAEITKRLKS